MIAGKIYLIVDDDADDQQFLIEALKEKNAACQCFSAFDGQEAVIKLTDSLIPLPDVIFLDLNMPVLNGRQCLSILRQFPSFKQIPVIIYSTTTNEKEVEEIMKQGASYFLSKNHSYTALLADLSSLPVLAVVNNL